MAIITISRGCCSRGREVAEEVSRRLGYACISREILLDASEIFHISQLKLQRAIHDAPSLLDRFTNGKERYVACIEAALLKFLKEDNIVYHGLAGHFFVRTLPSVLKVRIIADLDERIRLEMEREGVSREDAARMIRKDDEQRLKWSRYLYGIDSSDPSLYDLVIHIKRLSVSDAADIICEAVKRKSFESDEASVKAIYNIALAAEIRAAIVEIMHEVNVSAQDGFVRISCKAGDIDTESLRNELVKRAFSVRGVKDVKISFDHIFQYCE